MFGVHFNELSSDTLIGKQEEAKVRKDHFLKDDMVDSPREFVSIGTTQQLFGHIPLLEDTAICVDSYTCNTRENTSDNRCEHLKIVRNAGPHEHGVFNEWPNHVRRKQNQLNINHIRDEEPMWPISRRVCAQG